MIKGLQLWQPCFNFRFIKFLDFFRFHLFVCSVLIWSYGSELLYLNSKFRNFIFQVFFYLGFEASKWMVFDDVAFQIWISGSRLVRIERFWFRCFGIQLVLWHICLQIWKEFFIQEFIFQMQKWSTSFGNRVSDFKYF